MAIATMTAIILGVAALGTTAMMTAAQRKTSTMARAQDALRKQELEAQKKATTEVLAAPEKATERARVDSLQRRRKRAKTLLTSPTGVLEPAELGKKTLFGE